MLNDELVFKEYKAYVPPQWSEFDSAPSKKLLKKSFVSYLHAPASEVIAAVAADDEEEDGSTVRRGKKNWMEEMAAYCKAQEIKALSKSKSLELEAELRRRKKIAADRHEQTLAVCPGSDRESAKLLLTAVETMSALQIRKNAQRQAQMLEKKSEELEKHAALIAERNKQVEIARREKSQYIAETIEITLTNAEKKRDRQFEEQQRALQELHKKELERASNNAKRLTIQHEAEQEAQLEARRLVEARCAEATAKAEAQRLKFEEGLQDKFERTASRLAAASQGHEKKKKSTESRDKYQRGMRRRQEMRQAQVQSCEDAEKQRTKRIDELQRHREETVADLVQRAQERDQKAERKIETIVQQRLQKGNQILEKARSTSVNSSHQAPSDKSFVAEAVAVHLERKMDLDDSKFKIACEQERQSFEREKKLQAFEKLQQTRRYRAAAEHARLLAEHAEKAAGIRSNTSDAILAAHLEKEARSKKHFEAHQGETRESMLAASEAQAAKILAALELTRVKQHEELMKAVEDKQLRQVEKEQRIAARREENVKRKHAEQLLRDEEKRRFIEETNQEREQRLLNSLNEKTHRVESALRSREDLLHAKQAKLVQMSKETEARLKAEAMGRSAELDRKRKVLNAKEEARNNAILQIREARLQSVEEAAAEVDHRIALVQARATSQQEVRTTATVEKLVRVYELGKDRVKHISFTPLRARSASPNQ